jgi:hypothetical protein
VVLHRERSFETAQRQSRTVTVLDGEPVQRYLKMPPTLGGDSHLFGLWRIDRFRAQKIRHGNSVCAIRVPDTRRHACFSRRPHAFVVTRRILYCVMIFNRYGAPLMMIRKTWEEVCPPAIRETSSNSLTPKLSRRPRVNASHFLAESSRSPLESEAKSPVELTWEHVEKSDRRRFFSLRRDAWEVRHRSLLTSIHWKSVSRLCLGSVDNGATRPCSKRFRVTCTVAVPFGCQRGLTARTTPSLVSSDPHTKHDPVPRRSGPLTAVDGPTADPPPRSPIRRHRCSERPIGKRVVGYRERVRS